MMSSRPLTIPHDRNFSSFTGKGGRGEKKSTTASAKAGLQFPVGRIGRYLRQGVSKRENEKYKVSSTIMAP
jgi:hypothetical protein